MANAPMQQTSSPPNKQLYAKVAIKWNCTWMLLSAYQSLIDAAIEPHSVSDSKLDISNRSTSQVLPTRVVHKHAT